MKCQNPRATTLALAALLGSGCLAGPESSTHFDSLGASEQAVSAADAVVTNSTTIRDASGAPLFVVKAMYSASLGVRWARGTLVTTRKVLNASLLAHLEHQSGTKATVSAASPTVDSPTLSGAYIGHRACVGFSGYLDSTSSSYLNLDGCVPLDPNDLPSAPAPMAGQYYGIKFYSGSNAPMDTLINAVSTLVNTAADRYAAGRTDAVPFVTYSGRGAYTGDASIFASLVAAGVLPPGQGPGFFASALDGLNAGGLRLRVHQICDVVGIKRSAASATTGSMSFVFSNIARRGSEWLLETERFDVEQVIVPAIYPSQSYGIGWGWRIRKQDFARAEVSGVTSCASPQAQAALQDMLAMAQAGQ